MGFTVCKFFRNPPQILKLIKKLYVTASAFSSIAFPNNNIQKRLTFIRVRAIFLSMFYPLGALYGSIGIPFWNTMNFIDGSFFAVVPSSVPDVT